MSTFIPFQPGALIGPYRLEALLGQGGMAQVWKAWHGGLHRYEALKLLPPQTGFDRSFADRFLGEARIAANLQHPNIAAIHGVSDMGDQQPYFAMELVEGGDLADWIEGHGKATLEQALPVLRQIGEALDFAHSRGLIHRDIKPANVMLTTDGRVKVVDFGIARAQEETGGKRLTKTGLILGTPDYMSPEQGGSGPPVDHRTDIYSLGVIAYEMLCGQPPFRRSNQTSAIAVIMDHIRTPPPDPRTFNPAITAPIATALLGALAKEPAQRPPSGAAFLVQLSAPAPEIRPNKRPVTPPVPHTVPQTVPSQYPLPPAKKPVWPFVGGGVAFLGAVLIGVALTHNGGGTSTPPSTQVVTSPSGTSEDVSPPGVPTPTVAKPLVPDANKVAAPDVLGMRESQARAAAQANGLVLDVTTGPSSTAPPGTVASQFPASKIAISPGAKLTVRISTGPAAGAPPIRVASRPVAVPDLDMVPVPSAPRYSWPSSDAPSYTYPLSESDVTGKSADELTVMRNTIYARYGRRFKRRDLQNYFENQSWYHPNPRYRDGLLSAVEKRNAGFILSAQQHGAGTGGE